MIIFGNFLILKRKETAIVQLEKLNATDCCKIVATVFLMCHNNSEKLKRRNEFYEYSSYLSSPGK